jgi:hypothetical protein
LGGSIEGADLFKVAVIFEAADTFEAAGIFEVAGIFGVVGIFKAAEFSGPTASLLAAAVVVTVDLRSGIVTVMRRWRGWNEERNRRSWVMSVMK